MDFLRYFIVSRDNTSGDHTSMRYHFDQMKVLWEQFCEITEQWPEVGIECQRACISQGYVTLPAPFSMVLSQANPIMTDVSPHMVAICLSNRLASSDFNSSTYFSFHSGFTTFASHTLTAAWRPQHHCCLGVTAVLTNLAMPEL